MGKDKIKELADEHYEGCDGCTQFEEKMWKDGFRMGYVVADNCIKELEKENQKLHIQLGYHISK